MKTTTRKHEVIVNNEAKLHASFEVGDAAHQGDLIIVRIGSLPKNCRPRGDGKLAEGDTQGSRHVVERGDVYDADPDEVAESVMAATGIRVDTQYLGQVFVSPAEPTADDVTHPEHGNQGFPAGAVCAVVHQRNLDSQLREQRVQD